MKYLSEQLLFFSNCSYITGSETAPPLTFLHRNTLFHVHRTYLLVSQTFERIQNRQQSFQPPISNPPSIQNTTPSLNSKNLPSFITRSSYQWKKLHSGPVSDPAATREA